MQAKHTPHSPHDLQQLADHRQVRQFHVIGASCGANLALTVKALLPARVGKCILISMPTENEQQEERVSKMKLWEGTHK